MIFYFLILTLKEKENKQHLRNNRFSCFKKGKNLFQTPKRKREFYGEGTVNDQMCPKGVIKFDAGDFLLSNMPSS